MTGSDIEVARFRKQDLPTAPEFQHALESHQHQEVLLQAMDAGSFYLARIDGAYAGGMILDTGFFAQGFVWLIWVEEPSRRRGVATALMRHAEDVCGTDKLFTSTNKSNIPAQRLYETLGLVRTGKVENLDEGDPEIFYFKRLTKFATKAPP